TNPPLLETENLARVFGTGPNQVAALKGLTFEIRQGQSVAIIGKSGSGKSTLMHLLALLDEPTSGVVAMRGKVVSDLRPKEVDKAERKRRGAEVLEKLDMSDKIHAKAINLSGGQQQRVSIGRALINSPEIVFADEPTGNLDSETSAVVEDLLFSLNAEGQTLI